MRGAGAMYPRWKRAALLLMLLWILVTYLVISPLRCAGGGEGDAEELQERLHAATQQLDALRAQHHKLLQRVTHREGGGAGEGAGVGGSADELVGAGPSEEYEMLRRRIYTNTKELWYYLNSELTAALKEHPSAERLQTVLQEVKERKSSLLADQSALAAADGHAAWRAAEARAAGAAVQARLRRLQHPPDCRAARKLLCNLNKGCGFGCQVHHIAYCLIFAYATERTLVLQSRGWRYNAKGWEYVFQPLSDTCTDVYDDKAHQWPVSHDVKVLSLPFIDSISQKPKFLPLAVPKDLAHRISRFNGDPASWWVGQMLHYILRPRTHMQKTINDTIAAMDYKNPIVGIHIRRTDKVGTEAAFHHLAEYMAHAQEYWRTAEARAGGVAGGEGVVRRVYLASDDPAVLAQARALYPRVVWVGDAAIARGAATHRRYTPASLAGLLTDLTLLARADYLVCTFSSQVGRVAYELMQAWRGAGWGAGRGGVDASVAVHSLDDIYYFGGQNAHDRRAVLPHAAARRDEIDLQVGDLIGIAGNHWNGFGRGTNRRTNMNGLIPWYKTEDRLVLYPFPEYPPAPPQHPHPHPPGRNHT